MVSRFPLVGRLSADVVLTIATRLVIVMAGLVSGIVTARVLGPQDRGVYFLVVTVAGLVVQFGKLGLSSSNTWVVARRPTALSGLLVNSCWVTGGVLLGSSVGLSLAATALSVDRLLVVLGAALGATNLLFLLCSNLLVGLGRVRAYNAFQLLSNALALLAVLSAAVLVGRVAGFVAAALLSACLGAASVLLFLRRSGQGKRGGAVPGPERGSFDRLLFGETLRYALRAYVVTLLGFAALRGNVFLLQSMTSSEQVGYYSIALQMADVIAIVPISVALVLFPRLVRGGGDRYAIMLRQVRGVAILLLVACVASAALAKPFLGLAFGESYAESVRVYYSVAPGVFFLGLSTVLSQHLAAVGFPMSTFFCWVAALGVNVMAALLLVPSLGAVGAGLGGSLGYTVLFVGIRCAVHVHRHDDPCASKTATEFER